MPIFPWGKKADLVRQAQELLSECCQRLDLDEKVLGKSAKEWIARRKWDEDSVSDMRRMVYYAALMTSKGVVEAIDFPIRRRIDQEAFANAQIEELSIEDIVSQKLDHFFHKLGKEEITGIHKAVIGRIERGLMGSCLKWAKGNKLKAARTLGINRNTLNAKIKEYGLKHQFEKPEA